MRKFNLHEAASHVRGDKNPPIVLELRKALQRWLDTKPESQRSLVLKLFKERGWALIFTPSYIPTLELIETLWAHVKNAVASRCFPGGTKEATRQHILDGFYGSEVMKP